MEPLSDYIASKKIDKEFLSSETFAWETEVVYYNDVMKMWLSSPPTKSKKGTKYQFIIVNEISGKSLFFNFVNSVSEKGESGFLYNHNEGTVEITLQKPTALLFEELFLKPAQQDHDLNPSFLHPLTHYWSSGLVNIYY